jgi:hypothetical protein
MVAALERDKPGVRRNAAGNQPALLEWYGGIVAAMQHKRRRRDARQIVDNVDVSEGPQQTGRIRGRSRESLQVVESAHFFDGGVRQQQGRQKLPKGRVSRAGGQRSGCGRASLQPLAATAFGGRHGQVSSWWVRVSGRLLK